MLKTNKINKINLVKSHRLQKFVMATALVGLTNISYADLIITPSSNTNVPITNAVNMSVIASPTPQVVVAQIPSDTSTQKLIQVMHIDNMVDSLLVQQQQAAKAVKNLPANFPIPTDKKTSIFSRQIERQMQQILTKYSTVFGQQIYVPKRRQAMLTAYQNLIKQHYTQAEVTALIGFYDTPMGQQILQKQNQVNSEFLQSVMPMMAGDPKSLEQALPSLQQDIEKIFK